MANDKQKKLITEVMNADAKDGLYDHVPDTGKMITAVEFLIDGLFGEGAYIDLDGRYVEEVLDKSKQMEKEQFINFFLFFRNNGEKYLGMTIEQFVEQYYKETYGK